MHSSKYSISILLWVVLIIDKCMLVAGGSTNCSLQYTIPGDYILGGIFSLFTNSKSPCEEIGGKLDAKGVFQAEAMRYAIEQINNNSELLPYVTLGASFVDDGWAESVALRHTLNFVQEELDCYEDVDKNITSSSPPLIGIVGTSRSATTIPSTRLAELYDISLVSYYASSEELADKTQFPYFLRTIPPDGLQTGAIVDLLSHYEWNYIGLIHSVDSYGIHGARQLQLKLEARGICVAFVASVSDSATEKELIEVTNRIEEFNMARTIVMFSSGKTANKVLEQVKQANLTREISWIGGDDWGFDLLNQGYAEITEGAMFTRFFSINIPPFEKYVRGLKFEEPSLSPWMRAYWEANMVNSDCDDSKSCELALIDDFSGNYITLPVIDAVYVYAYGLHSLLIERCGYNDTNCHKSYSKQITGPELYQHLRKVEFDSFGGSFYFDAIANPPGKYILRNWQQSETNYQFVEIGKWESLQNGSTRLTINKEKVKFFNGVAIPSSICMTDCQPGEIIVPLEQKCCWGCQRCQDENYIVVKGTTCEICPIATWPDLDFTDCIPIKPTSINWDNAIALAIMIASVVGLTLSGATLIAMWQYRERRIIKAAGRELSAINFAGIIMSFISPFVLLLPPTTSVCISMDALISMSFTLTYASTLLKVNRIFRIFNASKKSVKRPGMLGPKDQIVMACGFIFVQIVIVVIGSIVVPTERVILVPNRSEKYAEYFCLFDYGFLAACVYNALLVFFMLLLRVPYEASTR
ncbi:metabotropic glutamate receptor-like [Amphiura filiformis]|uniref:metabotropic glutamate receptor-like n=1 Tax=Amphiura filiformis TaxID=82378 RepID=UPI003B213803